MSWHVLFKAGAMHYGHPQKHTGNSFQTRLPPLLQITLPSKMSASGWNPGRQATFQSRLDEIWGSLPNHRTPELRDIISGILPRITTIASDIDHGRHLNARTRDNAVRAKVLLSSLEDLQPHTHLELPRGSQSCQNTLDLLNDLLAEIYSTVPVGRYFHHGLRAKILQAQNKEYCRPRARDRELRRALYTACDSLVDLAFYVEHYDHLEFNEAIKSQLLEEKARLLFDSHFKLSDRYNDIGGRGHIIRQSVLALGHDLGWNIVFNILQPDARVRLGLVAGTRVSDDLYLYG